MRAPRPRPLRERVGHVYFATDGEAIKVGFSTDYRGRLSRLRWRTGRPLRLIAAFPGYLDDEEVVHSLFPHVKHRWRRNRDWYEPCHELSECVEALLAAQVAIASGRTTVTQVLSEKYCS